jgi:hypothetical protein
MTLLVNKKLLNKEKEVAKIVKLKLMGIAKLLGFKFIDN